MASSIDPTVDNYCVMGSQVSHSRSPQIHTAFAKQTQQNIAYRAISVPVEPGKFAEAVDDFKSRGGKGLNITVPFKVAAWQLSTVCSPRAEQARAVNTISFDDDKIIGDNTDGAGLVRDLSVNHKVLIKGKKILLLGAGGAVRGILAPLLNEQPANIVIANRTYSRAEELADIFAEYELSTCRLSELGDDSFDIIINGTSASLSDDSLNLPESILRQDSCCYDLRYADKDTAFIKWAKAHGVSIAVDGLGMLVEQAAESFFIWRGVRPETDEIIQSLR